MKSSGGTDFLLPVVTTGTVVALVAIGNYYESLPDADPDLDFVEEVLIADPDRSVGVAHWNEPIVVAFQSDEPEDTRLMGYAAAQLNPALSETGMSIRLESSQTPPANVRVVFAPREKWGEIAVEVDLDSDPYVQGWAWQWSEDEDNTAILTNGYIVINSRQPPSERFATILHELFHVVAAAGHSSQYYESIVNKSDLGDFLRMSELAEVDRALLQFLYGTVEAGDSAEDVRRKYSDAWPLRLAAQ